MTTMSAPQLIVMAVILVAAMAVWLSLVFLAARAPRQHRAPAGTAPGREAGAGSRGYTALVPPPRLPGDEEAALRGPDAVGQDQPGKAAPRDRVGSRA